MKKAVDLSFVFCVDPDKGQKAYDKLPPQLVRHLAACFAFKAGLAPDPGFYDGPAPEIPDEED
jgi:hypothetical protein